MSSVLKFMYRPTQSPSSNSSSGSSKKPSPSPGPREESLPPDINSNLHPYPDSTQSSTAEDSDGTNNPPTGHGGPQSRAPFSDQRRTIYVLANADANSNFRKKNSFRYRMVSSESLVQVPSYETVGRRRHLAESEGALKIPPVCITICILHILLYIFRDDLNVKKTEDVHVSWEHIFVKGEYWRLFIAQFFHFNRLNVIVNSMTLFAVGRYLERKITKPAMLIVIIVMSVVTHLIHILINPYLCILPKHQVTWGFGNIIYSLRVLLAYALEPRNYERDLVYGLYPMVVSASHAPWQPILDCIIFKIVMPEQCITGQLSGIMAGFLVTAVLLLWPTRGIYIAYPPYYWTLKGADEPHQRHPDHNEDEEEGPDSNNWRMRHYANADFWLPTSSNTLTPISETPSEDNTSVDVPIRRVRNTPPANSIQRRSDELKSAVLNFMISPSSSIVHLVKSLIRPEVEQPERKHFRKKQQQHHRKMSPLAKVKIPERNAKSEQILPRTKEKGASLRRIRPTFQPPPPQMSPSSTESDSDSSEPSPSGDRQYSQPTSNPAPTQHRRNPFLPKRLQREKLVTLYRWDAGEGCGDDAESILNREIH